MDYYEILEVNPKASVEVIERAYRVLAKRYHPDTAAENMSRAEAEEMVKSLSEAYEILSNPSSGRNMTSNDGVLRNVYSY